jgi:hypothetical protein
VERSRCEAPFHAPGCPCPGCRKQNCGDCHATNVDHFTAKSVGKALGWKKKEINARENKQWLSYECHRWKDENTPHYKHVAKKLTRGREVKFGDEVYKVEVPRWKDA